MPGSPWENGYCESFTDKLRDECLRQEIFRSLKDAYIGMGLWNKWRIVVWLLRGDGVVASTVYVAMERTLSACKDPISLRINRRISADLWPGADLAIALICPAIVWTASAMSTVGPLAALVFTALGLMPAVASYVIKTRRDRYDRQGWTGTTLYAAALAYFMVAMLCLAIVGLAFIANGL